MTRRRAAWTRVDNVTKKTLTHQIGGDHYRNYKIQPVEYSIANDLSFCAGNIVKYVTRYRDKGGAEDVRKIIHYAQLILEFEYGLVPDALSYEVRGNRADDSAKD